MRLTVALLAALTLLAVFAQPSPAPVPPKDCGFITVGDGRFNIKSDQLRCKKARKFSRKYLNGKGEPAGYSCQTYGPGTSVEFRCQKGVAVLFAIRR